jgi:nitroreductase
MLGTLSAWQISETEFPRNSIAERQLEFLLRYAILAPSTHNTQPWRFRIKRATLDLLADLERSLPVADPKDRELAISCGAALFNLRTAMNYFGCIGEARPFPDPRRPEIMARVTLDTSRTQACEWPELFRAITQRVTNRGPFAPQAPPASLAEAMREAAHVEGAWLTPFAGARSKETVGFLVAKGDRIQFDNPDFRRELASWLHTPRDHDGLPAYAKGAHELLGFATPALAFLLRTFDFGKGLAARDKQLASGSPLLACLGKARDTPLDWLNAGQALQRVLLVVTAQGFHASFLNQPIEAAQLRRALGALARHKGYPQILLRIGRGGPAKHTPRRPLEEVLMETAPAPSRPLPPPASSRRTSP